MKHFFFVLLILCLGPVQGLMADVVVNCDNDHYFTAGPLADELPIEERFSEAGLRKYIDLIARGGRVTHVFMCAVGQRANYDSKICDPIWMALDEAKARLNGVKAQDEQITLGLELR